VSGRSIVYVLRKLSVLEKEGIAQCFSERIELGFERKKAYISRFPKERNFTCVPNTSIPVNGTRTECL
jgi:hypothetical protein